jgi:hypothetical protein
MGLAKHTACMEVKRGNTKFWSENLNGRTRRRWEGNIKKDLRGNEWEIVDWIHLAQVRDQFRAVLNTVMNIPVP